MENYLNMPMQEAGVQIAYDPAHGFGNARANMSALGRQLPQQRTPERQAELDAAAKAAGYNNYEEMSAFMQRRSMPREQQTVSGAGGAPIQGAAPQAQPQPQQQGDGMNLIDYINNALSGNR